ncbi:hypothetical protein HY501_01830 [Candidatus Woesearchaeota archaeon]|nr:hypothetical protein [Candidatus Woesearchaeota archaeon]
MGKQKWKVYSLLVIALAGLFLTKHGITGMLSQDADMKPLCESDSECGGKTCCFFYGRQAGVCDLPENCYAVGELSKVGSGTYAFSTPEKKDLLWETIGGIIVSLITFLLFVYFLFFEPKNARVKEEFS